MGPFIYDSPTQDLRIEIREADYQPEDARRLELQMSEPFVTYEAVARIKNGRMGVVGKSPILAPLGEVERAVEMYLAWKDGQDWHALAGSFLVAG